ncbi:hypothetical protein [Paraburkholderia sp. J7]|uniref:hypothetical protein n=1 Tax=Paraburkholderia sp. J7 TaxID=2805438 RepID=UPI002AB6BA81|nr:hypothetical protein [Paraburkholderia sp. J7]
MLKKLQSTEAKLKVASVWNGSKSAVSIDSSPYVFELLCFLELCVNLEYSHALEFVKRKSGGKDIIKLPKAPGNKANFSYVKILKKNENTHEFDLNPGINITDNDRKDRAPDISITAITGDRTPNVGEVKEIWDAKYSAKDGRLNDKEVSDFFYTAQQLGFPRDPSALAKNLPAKEFNRSGIITNTKPSTEPDSVFARHKLHEVSGFPDAVSTRP